MAVEQVLEQLHRAKWTQAARDEHKKNGGYFAGPGDSFPLKDASDVSDAWGLAGHADNPDEVRHNILSWAKENGHTDALPESAKEFANGKKERAMGTELTHASANHEPMTGSHSHTHPAFGAQGDDSTHEHEHEHKDDNNHDHSHSEERALSGQALTMYAPITRVDETDWVIEGLATSDAVDHYDTIFDYESSKRAFEKWRGNIREMHQNKAVGRAVQVIPDDENRCIHLRARISRGARDTWEKILDGTLSGFSISVPPGRYKMKKVVRNGKSVPVYYDHDLAEVSVVDNPGSPGCDFAIVRADGFATDVLDTTEEEIPHPEPEAQPLERAGARVSSDTMSKMHQGIAHTLHAAVSQMQNCGCDGCMDSIKALDPDNDGDIDFGGYDDPDGDAESLYNKNDSDMERKIAGMVERALHPVYTRLQSIAGTLARSSNPQLSTNSSLESMITGALTRALADLPTQASLDAVRAELSAVKGQVDKIAEQPMPGMPIMHASSLPRPVEKRLPTDPYQVQRVSAGATYDAIAQLSASGQLDTIDKQVDALHAGLVAQRRG